MIKKSVLIFSILMLISCNATKTSVATKTVTSAKSSNSIVRSVKKKKREQSVNTNSSFQQRGKNSQEIIESSSRTVVANDVVGNYILQYKDIAMSNMKNYGIPASIILAQGILESGAGRGDLAQHAYNHFGIKCHSDWKGDSVRHDDDAKQECFRKYKNPSESFNDHSLFLTGRSRYASLFSLPKADYEAWARGLRAAGYATDPKYPEKLISYIERYNLGQYDAQVLGMNFTPTNNQSVRIASVERNKGNYHEVQKGDTLYSISRKYSLLVDDLKLKNNLSDNTLSVGQLLIVN